MSYKFSIYKHTKDVPAAVEVAALEMCITYEGHTKKLVLKELPSNVAELIAFSTQVTENKEKFLEKVLKLQQLSKWFNEGFCGGTNRSLSLDKLCPLGIDALAKELDDIVSLWSNKESTVWLDWDKKLTKNDTPPSNGEELTLANKLCQMFCCNCEHCEWDAKNGYSICGISKRQVNPIDTCEQDGEVFEKVAIIPINPMPVNRRPPAHPNGHPNMGVAPEGNQAPMPPTNHHPMSEKMSPRDRLRMAAAMKAKSSNDVSAWLGEDVDANIIEDHDGGDIAPALFN